MNTQDSNHINVHLTFGQGISYEPLVCRLAKQFDIEFNITKAQISTRREGFLVLDLIGTEGECEKAIAYLREQGVTVSLVAQRIWHNEEMCIDCGACTALCPTSALDLDTNNHLVFDKTKCVVCLNCTLICPVHALTSDVSQG